jgi:hypothetical protein
MVLTVTMDQNADTTLKLYNPNTGTSAGANMYITKLTRHKTQLLQEIFLQGVEVLELLLILILIYIVMEMLI